jgi:N-acetyl-alpha-D-glucosaminyl L-malate synthase BshA
VKRIEDVIRIFAKAREQVPCTLTLVGSGPELSLAQRLIAELNLAPYVTVMGDLGDTTALLQSSAVFLLPSQTESFGLAALEALACGVPVVASRAGGLPEVISDNETGLLFPPGDVNAMAGGVVRLLSDRALHAKFSAEGRRQAEARFRRDPLVDRYESIYRRVLAAEAQHR